MDLTLIGVRYNVFWSEDTQPTWHTWEVKRKVKDKYYVSVDEDKPVVYTKDQFPDIVERFDWRK